VAAGDALEFTTNTALSTLGCQIREVSIGDLAADALAAAGQSPLAFVAASELKEVSEPIGPGRVNSDKITALLSYPEELVVVLSLTGSEIRSALEKSVSFYPNKNLGFLQVSGLSFSFYPGRKSGQRVGEITVGDAPLVTDKNYEVAMTRSLGSGAIGYWRIWGKQDVVRETDVSFSKAVQSFLAAVKTVNYSGTDRIFVKP